MPSRSIANRLESARLALHNALAETELLAALGQFGYDETRLQQGKSYYEAALTLWQSQQQKQSRRRAASLAYRRADAAATRAYMRLVKLCRALYRDDPVTYRALGLAGQRSTAFAGRVAQMRLFYTTVLGSPEILTRLTDYGLSQSQLQNDFALISDLRMPVPNGRWRTANPRGPPAAVGKRSLCWTAGWVILPPSPVWPWKKAPNGWRCSVWPVIDGLDADSRRFLLLNQRLSA